MNEKIKELAKEAGMWRQHYDVGLESPDRLEKFTELIVKESLAVIQNQLQGDDDVSSVWVAVNIIDPVKNHFGIE